MESGMVEAGAMFACLMGLIKIIEKLVDQKMGKKNGPVTIDINTTEIVGTLSQLNETQSAIAQTLERLHDKMDAIEEHSVKVSTNMEDIKRVQSETGSNVFKVLEEFRVKEAKEQAREQGRQEALALAKRGNE